MKHAPTALGDERLQADEEEPQKARRTKEEGRTEGDDKTLKMKINEPCPAYSILTDIGIM